MMQHSQCLLIQKVDDFTWFSFMFWTCCLSMPNLPFQTRMSAWLSRASVVTARAPTRTAALSAPASQGSRPLRCRRARTWTSAASWATSAHSDATTRWARSAVSAPTDTAWLRTDSTASVRGSALYVYPLPTTFPSLWAASIHMKRTESVQMYPSA